MLGDDGKGIAARSLRFEAAWERYLIAEQRALLARAEGILGRFLVKALPGESQEELDRAAEEDRRLAREGLVDHQAVIALARRRVDVLWAMLRDGQAYSERPSPTA